MTTTQAINGIVLVKGQERYVFLFADADQHHVPRAAGRMAANPEVSFTWYDAALVCGEAFRFAGGMTTIVRKDP